MGQTLAHGPGHGSGIDELGPGLASANAGGCRLPHPLPLALVQVGPFVQAPVRPTPPPEAICVRKPNHVKGWHDFPPAPLRTRT